MNQLKFKLWIEGATVNFQVLEMPESLRVKGMLFTASNGWCIQSRICPEILNENIFLPGADTDADMCLATRKHDSTPDALRMMADILEALQEFAAKYKLTDQAEPTDDPHTYTLTFTNNN